MERKLSSMSTASSKLRNLKEFLSSTRSLSTSQSTAQINHHQNQKSGQRSSDHQMESHFKKSGGNNSNKMLKKSPKNSISLFNLMSPSSNNTTPKDKDKGDSKRRESRDRIRPVSAVFDDLGDLEPYGYSSPPTKSISMYGLARSRHGDADEDNPSSGENYDNPRTNNLNALTSRNFATRLFHNIRSKFRKRRRDRNKIVDSKSTDFGSFLGDRVGSGLEGDDDKSTHSSSARHPFKSSRSVDNVLESLFGSRRLRSVAFEFNEEVGAEEGSRTAHSYSQNSDEEESESTATRDNYSTSDNVFDENLVVGTCRQNPSGNFLLPYPEIGAGGSISPSSATSSPVKPLIKKCLTKELEDLLHFGWYWAGLSKEEAEAKLQGKMDGAFVVRDSSSDHYLLSLSFNSKGRTLHTRIEYRNGEFSFYSSDADSFPSVAELIDHCIAYSQLGVFCYSRARRAEHPSYPVRLTQPISRYTEMKSLLYLSRFVIRQYVRLDLIPQLHLPQSLIAFVSEQRYI